MSERAYQGRRVWSLLRTYAFPVSEALGISLAGRIEAEVILDRGKARSWLRVGPDTAGDDGSLVLAELKVMVGSHSLPLAHGASGLGRLDEIHLDAARREVVSRRVGGLEDTVALRGFSNHEFLL